MSINIVHVAGGQSVLNSTMLLGLAKLYPGTGQALKAWQAQLELRVGFLLFLGITPSGLLMDGGLSPPLLLVPGGLKVG